MQRVCHVEHVVPVTLPALWVVTREVLVHEVKLKELIIEVLYGKLIKLRNINLHDILLLDQLLILCKDLFGIILREHGVRAYIILQN